MSETPTAEQIAEWTRLEAEATPGPWEYSAQSATVMAVPEYLQIAHCMSLPGCGMLNGMERVRSNARFIAASRTAVPSLLKALSAERARADRVTARLAEFQAKVAAAEHDGGSECSYCHGVGACPRCWGRAGIERMEARAEAAEMSARVQFSVAKAFRDEAEAAERDAASLRERVGDLASKLADPGTALDTQEKYLAREVLRLLSAPSSSPADTAPYYLADGSTVMLPVEEVERRRKAAAKVIAAARYLTSTWEETGISPADGPDRIVAALAEFDGAASPAATGSDALAKAVPDLLPCGGCGLTGWDPSAVDVAWTSSTHDLGVACCPRCGYPQIVTLDPAASPSPGESDAIEWCATCGEPAGPACGPGHETGWQIPPAGYEREPAPSPAATDTEGADEGAGKET